MVGLENYYKLLHTPTEIVKYDEIWVVMLYAPKDIPTKLRHVRALAPTSQLYQQFKALKDKGHWGQDTFDTVYAPQYVAELLSRPTSMDAAGELLDKASCGRSIALVCTCYHESLCHRALLGGLVQKAVPGVEVKAEQNYQRYWE